MANIIINPSPLIGTIKIPPSKSISHRAIICAALSKGNSKIYNIQFSDDILATIKALELLGATFIKKREYLQISGIFSQNNNTNKQNKIIIDCNESGSTLRFLIPISLIFNNTTTFVGKGNLGSRPLSIFYEIFDSQNLQYTYIQNSLNLTVTGPLQPGHFKVKGNISSQFITGLLFALPLLNGNSTITITTKLESQSYIDLTLNILNDFGIKILNKNYKEFVIKGNQTYNPYDYTIEGDYSSGAFFLSAMAMGHNINISNLKINSYQGDKEAIDILKKMGLTTTVKNNLINTQTLKKLQATTVNASNCPDVIPAISAVASISKGTTYIVNAARLRIKECDRLHAITTELNKLGANITQKSDSLKIDGVEQLQGGVEVWSHKDHRIAMTLAIAATMCKEKVIIKDYECVSKSYPTFFEELKMLGGQVNEWCMG